MTNISTLISTSLAPLAYSEADRLISRAQSWESLSQATEDLSRCVALTIGASILRQAAGWTSLDLEAARRMEAEAVETVEHFSRRAVA